MSNLTTPYNFVPAAPFVLSPEWASQASHDHPFEDGLSGELSIELVNTTPLCVGGKQTPASESKAGKVEVYRTPENVPAIPGSSIKGMLRNVLAPVVFARMSQVEDRKLSVRDIHNTKTHYYKTIVDGKKQIAGWLRFENGRWEIKACSYANVYQGDFIKYFKLNERAWKETKIASERYRILNDKNNQFKTLSFNVQKTKNRNEAIDLGKGKYSGKLVVTGQPGSSFDKGKSAKKWEFIFYEEENKSEEWQPVPTDVLRDFLFVHEKSQEWEYFIKNKYTEIPVFFHRQQGREITSMGLAFMYRLAQQKSLHDALANISSLHLDSSKADFSELLFGRMVDDAEQKLDHDWSLRGRVNISLMEAINSPDSSETDETVLSSPKPSFYPAYLQQPESNKAGSLLATLDSPKPKLRGWKRYPVKAKNVQQPPPNISNKVKVRLETLSENTQFTGKIRFHNLRPVELGGLLWVLDFGERTDLRHALGMGKPYGLGQVKITIKTDVSKVVANNRVALEGLSTESTLAASRKLFIAYMNNVWQNVAESQNKDLFWEKSEQVLNILAMANPKEGEKYQDDLMYLPTVTAFGDVKKENDYLDSYISDTDIQYLNEETNKGMTEALVVDTTMTLEDGFEELEKEAQKIADEEKEAKKLEGMSESERLIYDLDKSISLMELKEAPKSAPKTIERLFKQLLEVTDEEWPELSFDISLVQRAEALNVKIITKAAKKVRVRLE